MLRGDHEQTIVQILEAAYPLEGCGVILRRADRGLDFPAADVVVLGCRNAAADPAKAYELHPDDYAAMAPRLAANYVLDVIFHSHPDGPATLSQGDKDKALNAGAVYLVASVAAGKVGELVAFRNLPGDLGWTEVWRKDVRAEREVQQAQDAVAKQQSDAALAVDEAAKVPA